MQFFALGFAFDVDSAEGPGVEFPCGQGFAYGLRNQDLPGTAVFGDAGGEVDRITEEIVAAAESDAVVDAGADAKTFGLGNVLVLIPKPALDGNGGAHGERGVGELRHDGVADLFDDHAMEFSNRPGDEAVVAMEQQQAGGVAKLVEVCRRPDDVRKEDRDLALVAPEFLVDLGAGLKKLVDVVTVKVHPCYLSDH